MGFIAEVGEIIDRNEGMCMTVIVCTTVVLLVLGCVYMNLRNTRIMAEKGYVEVPHQSITGTHWEKAK